jgi:hypothetical protein
MPRLVTEVPPPVAGSPGLVQGAYGDVGNLELAVPAADDGMWVFWFNADAVEHRAGAALGSWSGGLHVFGGHRVDATRITQMQAGPRYLELVAVSERVLHRLYWTPERGFVHAGPVARAVAGASPVRELPDQVQIEVLGADGGGRLLIGDTLHYPDVAWTSQDCAPPSTEQPPPPGFPDLRYDALAWCETSLDGGRIDVVLRRGPELAHLHGSGDVWTEPVPLVSRVWTDSPDASVHRR